MVWWLVWSGWLSHQRSSISFGRPSVADRHATVWCKTARRLFACMRTSALTTCLLSMPHGMHGVKSDCRHLHGLQVAMVTPSAVFIRRNFLGQQALAAASVDGEKRCNAAVARKHNSVFSTSLTECSAFLQVHEHDGKFKAEGKQQRGLLVQSHLRQTAWWSAAA